MFFLLFCDEGLVKIECDSHENIVGEQFFCNCLSDFNPVEIQWFPGNDAPPLPVNVAQISIRVTSEAEQVYKCVVTHHHTTQEDSVTVLNPKSM